jgi:hypothetical protein
MQNNILGKLPGLTVTALSLQVMRCSNGLDEQASQARQVRHVRQPRQPRQASQVRHVKNT